MRFVPILNLCLGGYLACPPVDGPKDPWPRVLSLPERFGGDPASLARDNILQEEKGWSLGHSCPNSKN